MFSQGVSAVTSSFEKVCRWGVSAADGPPDTNIPVSPPVATPKFRLLESNFSPPRILRGYFALCEPDQAEDVGPPLQMTAARRRGSDELSKAFSPMPFPSSLPWFGIWILSSARTMSQGQH